MTTIFLNLPVWFTSSFFTPQRAFSSSRGYILTKPADSWVCPDYVDPIQPFTESFRSSSSADIVEHKGYLCGPLAQDKTKEIESDLGTSAGISDPELCKVLAARFREYQLKDLEQFVESKLNPAGHPSGSESSSPYLV
ncbi:hypothetical protein FALBO_178 [Fusarium albosuccineum]|uniref:Uncharacterized protein n=1 Tax=Fusarium albosuccineum TaxID=1237068 RepID=A0A8H4LQZ4_9HYPO|nr:hypothetical protein FALBO_178 [Fusarium albosuccineum]